MELVILKPTDDQYIKAIEFNDEEIKKELALRLSKYEGIVYSESEIRDAKTDRATLNKFKEAIDTKRKEIKKKVLQPYEAFETKIKEIIAMVDKPINFIDSQVKSFEDKSKEEKKKSINDFYDSNIGEIKDLLPFQRLFNEKWLNSTVKLKEIESEIIQKRDTVTKDLEVIKTLKSEFELQIKDHYLRTFDLSGALAEKSRLEDQKNKLNQFESKKEKVETVNQPGATSAEPQSVTIKFFVTGSMDQINLVKDFLIKNKIQFGRI